MYVRNLTLVIFTCLLGGCVAGQQSSEDISRSGNWIFELILGIWHGVIAWLTVVLALLDELLPGGIPGVWGVFEKDSTGAIYALGFLIGVGAYPIAFIVGRRRLALRR